MTSASVFCVPVWAGTTVGALGFVWFVRKLIKSNLIQGGGTHRRSNPPLRVVITGATRGLGLEMAREFLSVADNVVITSRDAQRATTVAKTLNSEFPGANVIGVACDVTDAKQVDNLALETIKHFNGIDVWINNAGISVDPLNLLIDCDEKILRSVVDTNLIGTMFGCKTAIRTMIKQKKEGGRVGHVFNMDGAGSNGMATPNFLAYGASKAAFPQLMKTLVKETKDYGVGVHTLSPGMMFTDLLLSGNKTERQIKIFNILAVLPETSAAWLVPRVRKTVLSKGVPTGRYYKFLTTGSALWRFTTSCCRKKILGADKKILIKRSPAKPRFSRQTKGKYDALDN